MTPPDLTGDTPVLDIFKPVIIDLVKALWNELCLARSYSLDSRLCEGLHLNEPLCRYLRLNSCSAAVAGADIMLMLLNSYQIAALIKILNDLLSCLISVHTCILGIIVDYLCIIGHNIDDRQIMTLSDLKVIGVMSGSDLYNARSEIHFNIFISHNGYLSAYQRKNKRLADDILISFIVGIYCNSCIAQQSFGTCCCKLNIAAAVLEGIAQMPEMACLILISNLRIGKRGLAVRTPVNNSLAPVNKTLIEILYENFLNGIGAALVHCKALSRPIA